MTTHAEKDTEQGKQSPIAVGVQTCENIMEMNMAVTQKIWNRSTSKPSYTNSGHIHKGRSILTQKHLLSFIHSSFIHISRSRKEPRCPSTKD